MKNINMLKLKRLYYHFTHQYLTLNNLVIAVAFMIALGWAWGSIGVMERNYTLQKELDDKARQQKLTQLQVENLAFQQKYYQSDEYKELSIREHLGLGNPGEKLLVLPPNSEAAKNAGKESDVQVAARMLQPSNFQQWTNFLFGGASKGLKD